MEPFVLLDQPFAFRENEETEKKVALIKHRLQSDALSWAIKRRIKAELIKSKYPLEDITTLLPKLLEEKGYKQQLQNEIFRLYRRAIETFHMTNGWSRMQNARENTTSSTNNSAVSSSVTAAARVSDVAAVGGRLMTVEDGVDVMVTLPKMSLPDREDKVDVVQSARKAWIEFIRDQIMSISEQLNLPLAIAIAKEAVPEEEQKKKKSKRRNSKVYASAPHNQDFVDSGTLESDKNPVSDTMPKYTGVFGPSNVFEVCIKIQNPNHERVSSASVVGWGLIKLQLKPIGINSMREMFHDLDPRYCQVGIDDEKREWYQKDVGVMVDNIRKSGYVPMMQKFSRRGIPISARPQLWNQILNVDLSQFASKGYYHSLLQESKTTKYLIDDMIFNDVKRTCDDDNYFVFEDTLHEVMRAFSRDSWIGKHCSLAPLSLFGIDKNGHKSAAYPPNGVIPFEGLSLLTAPFCYLYDDEEMLYFTFRNFYCKHFCRLHIVSSEPDSLIGLCKCFEDLLMERDPQMFYHLLQMNVHPLSIAFHWIFHGFSGYLKVEELLLLWDRILGFGNLYLLPVLAAAIFWFRSKFLMHAISQQEIYDVFSDFTVIKCVPLLQLFLFN